MAGGHEGDRAHDVPMYFTGGVIPIVQFADELKVAADEVRDIGFHRLRANV